MFKIIHLILVTDNIKNFFSDDEVIDLTVFHVFDFSKMCIINFHFLSILKYY